MLSAKKMQVYGAFSCYLLLLLHSGVCFCSLTLPPTSLSLSLYLSIYLSLSPLVSTGRMFMFGNVESIGRRTHRRPVLGPRLPPPRNLFRGFERDSKVGKAPVAALLLARSVGHLRVLLDNPLRPREFAPRLQARHVRGYMRLVLALLRELLLARVAVKVLLRGRLSLLLILLLPWSGSPSTSSTIWPTGGPWLGPTAYAPE